MSTRTVEELRNELRQIDDELMRLNERERNAERGVDEVALLARRGDENVESQLLEYERLRASAQNTRRRLQAAHAAVESEIQLALAAAETEAARERAKEAKKVLAIFRKRGAELDGEVQKLLRGYDAIQQDMSALAGLGATRINPQMVKANIRRAMRSALMPVRTDLEIPPMPPLERRTFSALVGAWAGAAERWIDGILNEPEGDLAPTQPAEAVEQVQVGA